MMVSELKFNELGKMLIAFRSLMVCDALETKVFYSFLFFSLTPFHTKLLHTVRVGTVKKLDMMGIFTYLLAPKLQDKDATPHTVVQLKQALSQYFSTSSFVRCENVNPSTRSIIMNSTLPNLFVIPSKDRDDSPRAQHESYSSALCRLRDQVLSMDCPSFAKTVSERDWLKNSAKIWELVKSSPIIADYCRVLQNSGMYRK
ncbi:hypothetical protein JRO89_XS09G0095700 [Xanthoceras sorbifolium]|uniref:Uncharacterized protein n=1 Tax=Xanthoceras sorbifolium TaxID=99658 RepID=A0ABQ8HKV3_9ROSI|nr:hypothetical protein JRO89_XS09G0095700 [Xanthoceras sorbifolium]